MPEVLFCTGVGSALLVVQSGARWCEEEQGSQVGSKYQYGEMPSSFDVLHHSQI